MEIKMNYLWEMFARLLLGVDDSQAHQLELHFLLDCAQQVLDESKGVEIIRIGIYDTS